MPPRIRPVCRPTLSLLIALGLLITGGTAGGAEVPPGLLEQRVRGGLGQPVTFSFLPDGRVLIGERGGSLRLLTADFTDTATVGVIPEVRTNGEGSLGGVAFDPGWPARPYLYVFYTRMQTATQVLARYRMQGPLHAPDSLGLALGGRVEILPDLPDLVPVHNGGDLHFGPDSLLYLGLGDDGDRCGAQDSTSRVGAIWRLDVRGVPDTATTPPDWRTLIPSGNPYAADTTWSALAWCHGLRNPFRFSIDPPTGRVMIGDVGGNLLEEIDESAGGENFGWPLWEGDSARADRCGLPALEARVPPVYSYPHAFGLFAVTGGPVYRRNGGLLQFDADYEGDYFLAELYAGWIRRLRRSAGGAWSLAPAAPGQPDSLNWATGLPGISCLRRGPDGALYYTRLMDGDLRRIIRATESGVPDRPPIEGRLRAAPNPASAARGVWILAPGDGPSLAGGQVAVFDVAGRHIRDLGRWPQGAADRLFWDARDAYGRRVPAGSYFVRWVGDGARDVVRVRLVP